jgi:predicted dehydrogenase
VIDRIMHAKIRWGVIGSGGIARRRTIPEGILAAANAELAAVWDMDSKMNAEVAATFRAQPANSLDAFLGLDLDAVYIATPADCHREQVLARAAAVCATALPFSFRERRSKNT